MPASASFPRSRAGRGVAAGAAGTLAMDLLWFSRYRRSGGHDDFWCWESAARLEGWDGAPAPAQVGRVALEKLRGTPPPRSWARPVTNLVHWATGMGWGSLYGNAARSRLRLAASGLLLGLSAWTSGYVVLPLLGVYKPIWNYDAATLARDASAHLVFGLVTAAVYRATARGERG